MNEEAEKHPYLSRLLLNLRSRQVHAELSNAYEMHRTLMRAFPRKGDGGPGRVLFRVEETGIAGPVTVLLVQSDKKPDWSWLHELDGYLANALDENPSTKELKPRLLSGQRLRFRLLANPTRKIDTKSGPDGKRNNGKRVPVPTDRLVEWLSRKGEAAGFVLDEGSISVQAGFIAWRKPGDTTGQKIRSVRFDGLLTVRDVELFREALLHGIGPGKAFGFGLLSVARTESGALS